MRRHRHLRMHVVLRGSVYVTQQTCICAVAQAEFLGTLLLQVIAASTGGS